MSMSSQDEREEKLDVLSAIHFYALELTMWLHRVPYAPEFAAAYLCWSGERHGE